MRRGYGTTSRDLLRRLNEMSCNRVLVGRHVILPNCSITVGSYHQLDKWRAIAFQVVRGAYTMKMHESEHDCKQKGMVCKDYNCNVIKSYLVNWRQESSHSEFARIRSWLQTAKQGSWCYNDCDYDWQRSNAVRPASSLPMKGTRATCITEMQESEHCFKRKKRGSNSSKKCYVTSEAELPLWHLNTASCN